MGKFFGFAVVFGIPILIIWGLISIYSNANAEKEAREKQAWLQDSIRSAREDSLRPIINAGTDKYGWGYRKEEEAMTSDTTYTAFRYSDEEVITGGHWEDRTKTTATTHTAVVQNRQRYSNKTTLGRILNGPKSKTTTSTTVTSSTSPEWVTNKGHMKIVLTRKADGPSKAIVYCTSGEYNVNFSSVRIRFDKSKPVTFSITPCSYDSNDTDGFIIDNTRKFISRLKDASTMLLEDSGGNKEIIYTFQVSGLTWEY
ncbi:hypothetical protein HNQ91_001161 [Filimonas zeae]|nr:hypothetical protein [Filimonas zeae]MDR6338139.1 hypothetical protein [Filimonas zeae]